MGKGIGHILFQQICLTTNISGIEEVLSVSCKCVIYEVCIVAAMLQSTLDLYFMSPFKERVELMFLVHTL